MQRFQHSESVIAQGKKYSRSLLEVFIEKKIVTEKKNLILDILYCICQLYLSSFEDVLFIDGSTSAIFKQNFISSRSPDNCLLMFVYVFLPRCDSNDLVESFTIMFLVGRPKSLLALDLLKDGCSVGTGVAVAESSLLSILSSAST